MNPYPVQGGTAHPRGASLRTKLFFETNIPQVVKLDFNPPQDPRDGRFGPQFMYTVNNDCEIFFADPPLHEAILALGAREGDTIAIVKRKNGRATRWEVNHVKEGRVMPRKTDPDPEPAPQLVSKPRAERIQRELVSRNLMTAALREAIDAAEETGFAERAHAEDIRALAITIYIQLSGGRK